MSFVTASPSGPISRRALGANGQGQPAAASPCSPTFPVNYALRQLSEGKKDNATIRRELAKLCPEGDAPGNQKLQGSSAEAIKISDKGQRSKVSGKGQRAKDVMGSGKKRSLGDGVCEEEGWGGGEEEEEEGRATKKRPRVMRTPSCSPPTSHTSSSLFGTSSYQPPQSLSTAYHQLLHSQATPLAPPTSREAQSPSWFAKLFGRN